MDGITYRKCAKTCLEEIKSYCEVNHSNIANDDIKKMKEGRTGSSVFDQEITSRINEDKFSLIIKINQKLNELQISATLDDIFLPSIEGKTRSFYDMCLEGTFKESDSIEKFSIPINLKFVVGDNHDNVSGGLKLCGYLLSSKSIKDMDKSKEFSSKTKLLKYLSNNKESIKNQSNPRDYFIMTFYKDKDSSFNRISFGSILDGGIHINGAQQYPGLQLNMNGNKWVENFDYTSVPSIALGWMNQYVLKNEETNKLTKELFESITNPKEEN